MILPKRKARDIISVRKHSGCKEKKLENVRIAWKCSRVCSVLASIYIFESKRWH